ncbi:MAG: hypothetical protein KDB67_04300 [Gordonia sp.]|uniref:hypothetical protein n=1 Tax=Gordonia sp. (in: high G+C Gram-positive bacteria) TaxID=84139 RepID=UPI001D869A79|nr:hypothetical protein [Gordonia sp. (in: high G+C Gram-positive bacteria)]MCB1293886.1 hypothetical protein [Gordonia sp. (in: high G+C Gram-positive bacteria)]HMS75734.1 hypothetical protein [Gordonia sp. (in: high G+C Gram-positive bacteria)]
MSDDNQNPTGELDEIPRRSFASRIRSFASRHRYGLLAIAALSLAAIFAVLALGGISANSGTCKSNLSLYIQFAALPGSDSENQLAECASVNRNMVIGWDFLFILAYLIAACVVIKVGWWRYRAPQLTAVAKSVKCLPFVVAGIDIVENTPSFFAVQCTTGGCEVAHMTLARFVTTFASLKWALAAILLVVCVMSIAVLLARPGMEPQDATPASVSAQGHLLEEPAILAGREQQRGVCLSGGGIRATGFALGALSSLESQCVAEVDGSRQPIIDTVHRLTAVSGGSWAGTAWVLDRAGESMPGGGRNTAESVRDRVAPNARTPWFTPMRYLLNGPGGLLGPVLWVLFCTVSTLSTIAAITYIPAWLLGKILTLPFLFSQYSGSADDMAGVAAVPVNWANPGVFVAVFGLGLLVAVSLLRAVNLLWKFCAGIIVGGAVIFLYTGVAPVILSVVAENAGADDASADGQALGMLGIGGAGATAILATLWSQSGKTATGRIAGKLWTNLPRLFGVLLALLLLLCGLGVAGAAAVGASSEKLFRIPVWVADPKAFFATVAVVVVAYLFLSANSPTLAQLYGGRLTRSFDGVSTDAASPLRWRHGPPFPADIRQVNRENATPPNIDTLRRTISTDNRPGTWAWLADKNNVPELILCCAQQRTGLRPGAEPAESFTISPTQVTCGNLVRPLDDYLLDAAGISGVLSWRAYPRIEHVSAWLAVTGAAFSSAMGRHSLGSTNAALAACNADLGVWLPNPTCRVRPRPKPRIAYLAKEILGWYEKEDDFIFATDGGHWDNLGLIEQLRRGSTRIICIDASGDAPGRFTTLREAIALAQQEFSTPLTIEDLDGQLAPVSPPGDGLTSPASMAARISFRWESGSGIDGVIYYAKLQISTSMSRDLAEYGARDKQFPGYSTLNQVLKNEQFTKLFEAGEQAGLDVAKLIRADHLAGQTPWNPDQQPSTEAES